MPHSLKMCQGETMAAAARNHIFVKQLKCACHIFVEQIESLLCMDLWISSHKLQHYG